MSISRSNLFKQLFHANYQSLCDYAQRFIVDKQIVEDIVQEFFIAIWEKEILLSDEEFLPYAYRSVKNRCINHYRHQEWQESFFEKLSSEWLEQAQESEQEFLYTKEVQRALAKLPPKCKDAFMLKCLSGLKYKEIAQVMNISVNTVKYHLGEAFRLMREELRIILSLFILFFI